MKKILLTFLIVLVMFSSPTYSQQVKAKEMTISSSFFDEYLDFSISTFQEVRNDENILYSPVSLYYVLSMISVFSNDETYSEFETLLGVDKETLISQIPLLTNDILVDYEGADYWLANFIYYDNQTNIGVEEYVFNETILNEYQESFNYELQDITFYDGSAGEMIAQKINDGTNGFLTLTENELSYLRTNNILFNNTIYYNGVWRAEYDDSDNYEDTFYLNNEETVIVEYMEKLDTTGKYYEAPEGTAVKSYFEDGSSMIYILPSEGTIVDDLLTDSNNLKQFLEDQDLYQYSDLTLTIPKMESQNIIYLEAALSNLGLSSIFTSSETTFPGLTPYPFAITDVMQYTKIRVDEIGVEVVASTMGVGCTSMAEAPPYEFKVDRPFIYVIMSSTDIPLFIGVTYNI